MRERRERRERGEKRRDTHTTQNRTLFSWQSSWSCVWVHFWSKRNAEVCVCVCVCVCLKQSLTQHTTTQCIWIWEWRHTCSGTSFGYCAYARHRVSRQSIWHTQNNTTHSTNTLTQQQYIQIMRYLSSTKPHLFTTHMLREYLLGTPYQSVREKGMEQHFLQYVCLCVCVYSSVSHTNTTQ